MDAPPDKQPEVGVIALLELLEGGDHWQRVEAIASLGQLGDAAAVPALIKIVGDQQFECWHTRVEAIDALAALGAVEAAPHLRAIVRDSDPDIREHALDALKQLREKG